MLRCRDCLEGEVKKHGTEWVICPVAESAVRAEKIMCKVMCELLDRRESLKQYREFTHSLLVGE